MQTSDEIRTFNFDKALEVRVAEEDNGLRLSGYAALYEVRTLIPTGPESGFYETFERGAFSQTIQDSETIFLLRNHISDQVLSNTGSGMLVLESDDVGLRFSAVLPETTLGRDTVTDVRAGNLTGMSVGMPRSSIKAKLERVAGLEFPLRKVSRAGLVEISVATVPAETRTTVTARSIEAMLKEPDPVQRASAKNFQLRLRVHRYRNP